MKAFFLFALLFSPSFLIAQEEEYLPVVAPEEVSDEEPIFTIVEEMPFFGEERPNPQDVYSKNQEAIKAWLDEKIAQDKPTTEGTVYVTFVVETNGQLTGIKLLRGVNEELDRLALRYVSEMPKWTPGRQRGKLVRVNYNLPVRF